MKTLFKLSTVLLTIGLAACQTTAPTRVIEPVDAPPPTLSAQQRAAATPTPPGARQSSAVITLHLAQVNSEPSLIEVDAGGNAPLYALPQPVLTQADMSRVTPVTAEQGTFIMLEMTAQGAEKLRTITEQAKGHYLLLSVQGNLVNVAQIGETINDGRLLVRTRSPEHTQTIIRMMRGQ